MMNAALANAGISGSYEARDLQGGLDAATLFNLHEEGFDGCNVTVPFKQQALLLSQSASDVARAIGAANTLVRTAGGWHAENTDGPGARDWIRSREFVGRRLQRAVVVGAGGSARAFVWALLEEGAKQILLLNRTPARAEAIAALWPGRVRVGSFPDIPEDALLVQCTSLGLRPDDPLPVPLDVIDRVGATLDLVYPTSPWVQLAQERGRSAEGGLELLAAQGWRSFECWTGMPANREVMRRALLTEIKRRSPG